MARSNEDVVRGWFLEVWNEDRPERMGEYFAEDGIAHGLGEGGAVVRGPEGYLPFYKLFREAFPDITFELLDHVVDGDKIASRWQATATHAGAFLSAEPTGRRIDIAGQLIARVEDGKYAEVWNTWDSKALLEQLGCDVRSNLIDRGDGRGPRTPEEVHERWAEYFSAGDLDGLVSLYEKDAALSPAPGEVVHGHEAIRAVLERFLGIDGEFEMRPREAIRAGDVAILYSDWTLSPNGAGPAMGGRTTDVVRRQPNGTWAVAVDNPYGAGGSPPAGE
jgi:ketosteroid isomerase-like protein/predicted ester cyclase